MAEKWSGAAFTAADVADIIAATSSFMGIGATVTSNFKITAGKLAQWFRQIGFATAFAVASLPAVTWSAGTGSGVDNAAGNWTVVAPLSTGAATPASLIFQTGVVGASSSTVQTATTGLTLTSSGAVPVATFAGVVGIGTAGVATTGLKVLATVTAAGAIATGANIALTATAAANADVLRGGLVTLNAGTPGAFTGLVAVGWDIAAFTVAGYTTPGNPVGIRQGIITATGAAEASALSLAPPTGASTNYLIRHTTAATFNVLASGAITAVSLAVTGAISTSGGQLTVGVPGVSGLQFINNGVFGTLDAQALVFRTTSATRMTIAAGSGNITFTGDLSGMGAIAMNGAFTGATSLATSGAISTSGGQLTVGVPSTSGLQFINDGTMGTIDAQSLKLRTTSATRLTIAADGSLMTIASGTGLRLGVAAVAAAAVASTHKLAFTDNTGTAYNLLATTV